MPRWLLIIVGLVAALLLGFLVGQGPLSPETGPDEDAPAEQTEEQPAEEPSQEEETDDGETESDEQADGPQQPAPKPSAEAQEVMAQARQAQGGPDALADLNGYHVRTRDVFHQRGQTFTAQVESWIDLPNRIRQMTEISIQGQTQQSLTVWNGETGWTRQQGQVQELSEQQNASVRQTLQFHPVHALILTQQDGYTYQLNGTETIDGTTTDVLQVRTPEGQTATFYISQDSRLPIQRTRQAQGQTIRTRYLEYDTYDGYRFPVRQETQVQDQLFRERSVLELRINPGLEEDLFTQPEAGGNGSDNSGN